MVAVDDDDGFFFPPLLNLNSTVYYNIRNLNSYVQIIRTLFRGFFFFLTNCTRRTFDGTIMCGGGRETREALSLSFIGTFSAGLFSCYYQNVTGQTSRQKNNLRSYVSVIIDIVIFKRYTSVILS